MPNIKKVNVICIKWGNKYTPDYVNKMKNMIKRNTSFKVDFYCFTNDKKGLDKDVKVKPLPVLNTLPEYKEKYAYRKEAALCDDKLGGLNGERVFFFDLDDLIVGNLDDFFKYPKGKKFYIINDWNSKGEKVGQASCYSWVVGTLGFVKTYFEKNPKAMVDKFYTASQEYLSYKVIEKFGKLNFWPENWFRSFRFHCMPIGILRQLITPKLPKNKDLKVVCFHGNPSQNEAISGVWLSHDCKTPIKGWKKIYKHCKPTKWILDYWK